MARKKKVVKDPMEIAIANLEKGLGNKGDPVIYKYGDVTHEDFGSISFGYPAVDEASNIGGVPRGKMVEIFGFPSAGKSFLSLNLIASAQEQGLKCLLIDVEQSFDPTWAAKHNVQVDELYLITSSLTAEKCLDYVNDSCACGKFGLVVVDSTAALVPKKEMEGSVEDADYALLARAMSKACRKIVNSCGQAKTTCVFINQVRDDIGSNKRGGDVITCGGKALPFYAHQRISVWPGGVVKAIGKSGEEEAIAKKSYVTFVKNKTAIPYGKCVIEIVFDETAMNPIVKMVTLAKSYKLFNVRLQEYGIKTEFVERSDVKTKFFNTETSTFGELAHWVMSNGFLEDVLWALKDIVDDEEDDDKLKLIDPVIYQLIATDEAGEEFLNQELWESPFGDHSEPTDASICKVELIEEEDLTKNDTDEEIIKKATDLVKGSDDDILKEEELDLE
jgi:recombination protein RecA